MHDAVQAAINPESRNRKPRSKNVQRVFEPLEKVTRSHVLTEELAHYLNISEQTARVWAAYERGPIRPLRIPGVLALQWPVAELRKLLGVEAQS